MRILALVLGIVVAALGVVVGAAWRRTHALEGRIAALEASAGATSERPVPTPDGEGPTLSGPGASAAAVAALERGMADLAARVGRQEVENREMARAVAEGTAPSLGRPEFEEAVRGVVERMLEDEGFRPKVAVAAKAGDLPKKPRFDALAKALSLDDAQSRRFREDLQSVQGELFTLLSEPRADGPSWMERIVEMEGKPEADPQRAQVFLELMKAKIPGTETTYLEKAVALATEFRRQTGDYLRPEQSAAFARMDVDLFGVQMD